MTEISWKDLKPAASECTEINYKGAKFWAYRKQDYLHINNEPITVTSHSDYWGGNGKTYTPAATPVCFYTHWTADSSCAYQRFKPGLSKHKDAPIWLEWYLKDMDYRRAVTCYLTRKDGPVAGILPVLVKMGFNQVAINRSTHDGAYPVYLLVHPGTNKMDRYYYKPETNKKKKIDEPSAVVEME